MSDRLPYELQLPQQWEGLPLPDVNLAWADMKRRLDEDDDRRPVAWWRRGCMLWGFLLLALLGTGWWIFHPEKWFQKNNTSSASTSGTNNTSRVNKTDQDTALYSEKKKETPLKEETIIQPAVKDSIDKNAEKKKVDEIVVTKTTTHPKYNKSKKQAGRDKTGSVQKKKNKTTPVEANKPVVATVRTDDVPKDIVAVKKDTVKINTDITKPDILIAVVKNDTVKKKEQLPDTAVTKTTAKKDSAKKKTITFSAGIALQQQVPIAGQGFTPYNSLGRKGTLADYIPSVYLRMIRPGKWFLQTEFRYGAPQYVKKTTYQQIIVPDTGSNPQFSTKTLNSVKKTYYHQLPLTFNYYIAKDWSLGAGMQWNKLYAAVSESTVSRLDNFTQQESLVTKSIFSSRGDTASAAFKRSYWQAVIESQYKWKRFSFGARYTVGLEPYLHFTLPNGSIQEERNHSLQFFIRYELWKSKK